MHVLITGSSGFVGSAVTTALARAGYRVRAASRKRTYSADIPGVEWKELHDLEQEVDWAPLLEGMDVVIHLAGIAHRREIVTGQFARINGLATAKLVKACSQCGIERLIFMSSIDAQASSSANHAITERDQPLPLTAYGESKLAAEEQIRRCGLPFTILRPVVIYGPGAKGNVAMMMRMAMLPLPLPFGAFKNRRSLLSIDNLVQAVLVCLENPKTINRTFIVADADPITLAEMLKALREGAGRSTNLIPVPPMVIGALINAAGYRSLWDRISKDLVASSADLQKMGWYPHVQTRDGLRAMATASMALAREHSE